MVTQASTHHALGFSYDPKNFVLKSLNTTDGKGEDTWASGWLEFVPKSSLAMPAAAKKRKQRKRKAAA